MLQPPKKFTERIGQKLKNLQSVAQGCQARDINESDTVTLVMDILCDLLGYDKYGEVTKEHQIRSTFCDLAIQVEGKMHLLIEVKAIGISLKDNHMQQALNYAANKGCEWVVLTNAVNWRLYRVVFGQPITSELVLDLDLIAMNPRKPADAEALYCLSREGAVKSACLEYYSSLQAKDRYLIAALLMNDSMLKLIRKELRAMNPNVRVEVDEILEVLRDQVIKRELLEGEKADDANKRLKKHQRKSEREKVRGVAKKPNNSEPKPEGDEGQEP